MKFALALTLAAAFATRAAAAETILTSDPPVRCANCAALNKPHEPYKIYGNTYYVGVAGLSSILIVSDKGLILLDGDLTQSAPLIAANIAKLGFKLSDVKVIGNSHTHYDHAGGIAALQRASGAEVVASAESAKALENGGPMPDDPQYKSHGNFPAVKNVRVVKNGETVRVGNVAITAHYTPGHTPGGTTWTWKSCEGERCLDVVYADSLSAVSSAGFRFTGDADHPSIVGEFRRSISTVADLPCDILLTPHPGFTGLDRKLAERKAHPETNPFIDPDACRVYAARATEGLEKRVAEETAQ